MSISISGDGSITGSTSYTFDKSVSIAGTASYEDVASIDAVGIITAQSGIHVTGGNSDFGNFSTYGTRIKPSNGIGIKADGNPIREVFHVTNHTDSSTKIQFLAGGDGIFQGRVSVAQTIAHAGDTNTNIQFPAADTITAETAGSERLRIDSSGRVLIGTASGDYTTEIVNETEANLAIRTYNNGAQNFAGIRLFKARGTKASPTVVSDGDTLHETNIYGYDGSNFKKAARISAFVDGTPGTNDMPGRLIFATTPDGSTTPTERLRISSNGAITATGNFTTGGSIISEANPEASDTTNGAMLDKVKVVVRNAAGQSVWLGYKNGTSGATSSINVDGDTTIRDLTVRTVTSSDQVISNRSGTSVCFRAQSSGTDNLQILANGKIQSGSNYTDGDGVNIFGGGSIYIRQDGATGGVLRIRNGSDYKIELKGNGNANFTGEITAGAIDVSATNITGTQMSNHGIIYAQRVANSNEAVFQGWAGTSKNVEFTAGGTATFNGAVKIGGTAAANQIDEYEEGSWTPNFTNCTYTPTVQFGRYTKIGRYVYCTITIDGNSMSGSGTIGLEGLPFSSTDVSDDQQRSAWHPANGGHMVGLSINDARFRVNGTTMQGVKGATGNTSYMSANQLTSGTFQFTGDFSYYTA